MKTMQEHAVDRAQETVDGLAPLAHSHADGGEHIAPYLRAVRALVRAKHAAGIPLVGPDGRILLQTTATIAGGGGDTEAVHEIRQEGDDVTAAEYWTDASGEVQRYEVRLTLAQLVHLVLNMTEAERAAIDARADWRGVP
jgi:hypothetical protein